MTKDGGKKLVQFLLDNYQKNYPHDMGKKRIEALLEDLLASYKDYDDDVVIEAYREWRNTSKFTPYPNEIIEKLPRAHKPIDRRARITDSDGCVYMFVYDEYSHHNDWVCVYNPIWSDDDPRLARYWELIRDA